MDEIIERPESAEDAALSKIIARHEWVTSRGVPLRYQRRDIDDLLRMLRAERANSEGLRKALTALYEACERRANEEGGDFGAAIGPAAELAEAALSASPSSDVTGP